MGGREELARKPFFWAALGDITISLYCMASQLQVETQSGHLLPSDITSHTHKQK